MPTPGVNKDKNKTKQVISFNFPPKTFLTIPTLTTTSEN